MGQVFEPLTHHRQAMFFAELAVEILLAGHSLSFLEVPPAEAETHPQPGNLEYGLAAFAVAAQVNLYCPVLQNMCRVVPLGHAVLAS